MCLILCRISIFFCLLLIFFFKQKTAYEMRISDWSSDVCSSDLAFATDPGRGVFILGLLVLAIGGSLALFAWRAPQLKGGGLFQPVSREGALVLNNLLLVTAAGTVLLGTLYPLFLDEIGRAHV